jgi:ubiquitin-protein ligase E3 A
VRRLFWEVLHSMDLELKRKFLVFATGSDRVPIKGLGNLKFVISKHGTDESRLPSAHTCFNHLLLPAFTTEEVMRKQLLKAITDTEGFHLV